MKKHCKFRYYTSEIVCTNVPYVFCERHWFRLILSSWNRRSPSLSLSLTTVISPFLHVKLSFDQWRGENFLARRAVDNWVAHFTARSRGRRVREIERLILQPGGMVSLEFCKAPPRKMEPRLGIYFDKSSFYGGARLPRGSRATGKVRRKRLIFRCDAETRLMTWLRNLRRLYNFRYRAPQFRASCYNTDRPCLSLISQFHFFLQFCRLQCLIASYNMMIILKLLKFLSYFLRS